MLILTPIKDAAPHLPRYFAALAELNYPPELLSIGFLESDSTDGTFELLAARRPELEARFRRVTLVQRDFGYRMPSHVPRWAPELQLERRTVLAKSRNHLLMAALADEDWVLWLDVDVVDYPPDILARLLATGKDIVTPHCVTHRGGPTFDLNAWRDHGRLHLQDLRGGPELVPLDAVGGTMLLVRADAHRDGLIFPAFLYGRPSPLARDPTPLMGEGTGEVETEGLGLMAREMGYACWGMPNLEIVHASESSVAPPPPVAATLDRLDVVGPFLGPSGYDRHTRELVSGLASLGVEIGLTNLEGWSTPMPEEMRNPWFESLPQSTGADTTLHFTMPDHVRPRRGRRNVNYTMFEASTIPAAWAAAAERCDLVVVPTHAARDAWTDSGVDAARVRVSPLGVDGEFFSRPAPPMPLALDDGRAVADFSTRFLHVGELRPRKNQIGLLRTWLEATTPGDDAVLILKCPAVPHMVAQLLDDIQALQQELGRTLADAAPACLLSALLTEEQMLSLYAAATHYISMSHGEGWDQVMMEAAVAGLHLIAPSHTAYVEYLGDEDAEFIPSTLGPATFEGRVGPEDSVFFRGLSWWHPDEAAAVEIIRGAIAGTCARQEPPSARIASTYTWQAAARRLLDVIADQPTTNAGPARPPTTTGLGRP